MVLLIDGGDNIAGERLQDSIKAEYYYRGLSEIGYDAVGLGDTDLNRGQDFILDLARRNHLDLICANVHDAKSGELFTKPYVIKRLGAGSFLGLPTGGVRVGITSVMFLEDEGTKLLPKVEGDRELIIKDPMVAARSAVQEMRGKSDIIICIAHTGMDAAKEIARGVAGVDIMLVGHGAFRNKEPVFVGKTCLMQPGSQGRMVAVFDAKITDQKRVAGVDAGLNALTSSYPDDEQMLALVGEYRQTIRTANIIPEWEGMDEEIWVGDGACGGCHTAEHDQWKTTRHAHAWQTLVDAKVDTDPECVRCHVTGFGYGNGFRHKDVNPMFENVQCEMCHGPGKKHIELITSGEDRSAVAFNAMQPISPNVCTSCHKDEHDPDFVYENDIFLVAHDEERFRAEFEDVMSNLKAAKKP